jgi:hypothetical protein
MKTLVYKNYVGDNPRKREISVEERSKWTNVRKGGLNRAVIVKQKTCKYFIESSFTSKDALEIREWIQLKKTKGCRKNRHVLKTYDEKKGETKIICKVLGDFYVVNDQTVFKIVYVNQIKVQISDEKNERFNYVK